MTTIADREEVRNEFRRWFQRKVDKGESSDLDRLERIAIDIFLDWFFNHYSACRGIPEEIP